MLTAYIYRTFLLTLIYLDVWLIDGGTELDDGGIIDLKNGVGHLIPIFTTTGRGSFDLYI